MKVLWRFVNYVVISSMALALVCVMAWLFDVPLGEMLGSATLCAVIWHLTMEDH